MKVYVILGRFGDIYMVCRKIKTPSIIACLPEFSSIVKELFPQHEIFELPEIPGNDPLAAAYLCQSKFFDKCIIICQLDQQPRENVLPYRNFQAYQEYHAQL